MKRIHPLFSALIAFTAAVCLGPKAQAVVSFSDEVFPTVSGDFGIPPVIPVPAGFPDVDMDLVPDVIFGNGNDLDTSNIDPFDPTGDGGAGTFGLAWDDPEVWRNYESRQNVVVGQLFQGTLTITGGDDLRFQHLVLGGPVAQDASLNPVTPFGTMGIDVSASIAGTPPDPLDLPTLLDEPADGTGFVTITGAGSTYNNDPAVIAPGDLFALEAATVGGAMAFLLPNGGPLGAPTGARDRTGGFDVYVGLTGGGVLDVLSGGALIIQDALVVGAGASASGTVTVDGLGSLLSANGRDDFAITTGDSTPTTGFGSIIGVNGPGTLYVTDGGRANFFNGLSLGAENGGTETISNTTNTGSGTVIVEGAGSTLTAYASEAIERNDGGAGLTALGLAVGELRNTSNDSGINGDFGSGLLRIGDGATVNVSHTDGYTGQSADGANAEVGRNGVIEMRGGSLLVGSDPDDGGELVNDGLIEGYGLIRANEYVNTPVAVLRGGTPEDTLGTLSMIVNSDVLSSMAMPDNVAFLNLGAIEGDVDITVNGGFGNGERTTMMSSNGGVIRAAGSIQSATFFNHPEAEVIVETGETLSIRAVGDVSVSVPELIEGDGTDQLNVFPAPPPGMIADVVGELPVTVMGYSQANLGAISVNGGTLEVGAVLTVPSLNDHRFRNTRLVNPATNDVDALGTIASDDGDLVFHTGLVNTGVVSFTGGANEVYGEVFNADEIDYDSDAGAAGAGTPGIPGFILVSGDATSVTFHDHVTNDGIISIGPTSNVVTFLDDLTSSGAFSMAFIGFAQPSAAIVVSNNLEFNGGDVVLNLLTAGPPDPGVGIPLLTFGGSLNIVEAPTLTVDGLAAGQAAGISVTNGQLELVVIDSAADSFMLGDANGDGVIDAVDYVIIRESQGMAVAAGTLGDANSSGFVDQFDLATWQFNYGSDFSLLGGPLSVPEPGAAALALLAMAAGGGRRRR